MKILTVLLICCGIAQTSCSQITKDKKDEANSALNRAYKLLYQDGDRSKNLDSVVLLCSRVIEIDSNRTVAYDLKSTALIMQGKPMAATGPLTSWLNSHPEDPEFLLKRGLIYEKLKKDQEASSDFKKLNILIDKRMVKINNGMIKKQLDSVVTNAMLYYLIGKTEQALAMSKQLETIFPSDNQIKKISELFATEDRQKLIYNIIGF